MMCLDFCKKQNSGMHIKITFSCFKMKTKLCVMVFQTWHPVKISQPRSLLPLKRKQQPGDCQMNFFKCFDMNLYLHNGEGLVLLGRGYVFPMLYVKFHLISLELRGSIYFTHPPPNPHTNSYCTCQDMLL